MADKEACPFEWGDRVDHRIFGFGTVNGESTAAHGPSLEKGSAFAGWLVPVQWDDPSRAADRVAHWALQKVSSPDAKGHAYWERQWNGLLDAWLAARKSVEDAVRSSFRPAPGTKDIAELQARESEVMRAVEQFLEDDRKGLHP